MPLITVPQLLSAVTLVPELVRTSGGVPTSGLCAAEQQLGRALPAEVRAFYQGTDGLELDSGDLTLYTLAGTDEELGVVEAAATYRSWDWEVPDELVILGGDGQDRVIGVWVPAGVTRAVVVVAEESLVGPPALAVLGTSLSAVVAAWTAHHLPLAAGETEEVAAYLDRLGVPSALREGGSESDEEHLSALLAWASPDLPDEEPDASARPVAPDELTRLASG